jgi:pyruvate,orthophosphate dikinase
MFSKTVLDVDGELFSEALDAKKAERGVRTDPELTAEDLKELVTECKQIVREQTGADFPQDTRKQLDLAIEAVFNSWNTSARSSTAGGRRSPTSSHRGERPDHGVRHLGDTSGPACLHPRPSTGHSGVYGDYLVNAQGEDVVAGIRNTLSLADLEDIDTPIYRNLRDAMSRLENHYRDLCDIEFTIESGRLWLLQTRVGKRTAGAAFRGGHPAHRRGPDQRGRGARARHRAQLTSLMFPQFDDDAEKVLLTKGMAASPGAAVGEVVFDSAEAVRARARVPR